MVAQRRNQCLFADARITTKSGMSASKLVGVVVKRIKPICFRLTTRDTAEGEPPVALATSLSVTIESMIKLYIKA